VLLDVVDLPVDFLRDFAPVSVLALDVHIQLAKPHLELVDVPLLDREDLAEHVPIHELLARRNGERALVDPPVREVHEGHEVAERHLLRDGVVQFKVHAIEEPVDDVDLLLSDALVILLHAEDKPDGCVGEVRWLHQLLDLYSCGSLLLRARS